MATHSRHAELRSRSLQHLRRRELRERLYRANLARASSGETRQHGADRRRSCSCAARRRSCSASRATRSCHSPRRWRPTSPRCERLLEELRARLARRRGARARRAARVRARARRDRASSCTGTSRTGPSASARRATRTPRRSCGRTSRCRACSTGCSRWPSGCSACDPRRRRRGAGVAPRRALLPRQRRVRRAARGLLSRSVLAARREARRRVDGRVPRPQPAVRGPRRARAPAGRAPGLQPDAARRRQALADELRRGRRRCSTSSATACSTC